MRNCGIIILVVLASCKTTPPTASKAAYSEDLRVHRHVIEQPESDEPIVVNNAYTPLEGHIGPELDSIIRVSRAQNSTGVMREGYVIQIYTGNDRDRANQLRDQMHDLFPELQPKVSYHQPNFRVKAGRFTDRLEAHKYLNDVKKEFSKALLIPERFKIIYGE